MTVDAEFDASPERVWQLWADPRQLERWWGPPTYPATFTKHDLAPGSRVEYHMTGPEGDQPKGYWDILEVDAAASARRPRRLRQRRRHAERRLPDRRDARDDRGDRRRPHPDVDREHLPEHRGDGAGPRHGPGGGPQAGRRPDRRDPRRGPGRQGAADGSRPWPSHRSERLIGTWDFETARRWAVPGPRAATTFEWIEDGAFVLERADDEPDPRPRRTGPTTRRCPIRAVIGWDDTTGECAQLYADARGVFRIYRMRLTDEAWTAWRDAPGFLQRFVGAFRDDGRRSRVDGSRRPTGRPGSSTSTWPTARDDDR